VPENEADRKRWLDSLLRKWMKNPFAAELDMMYGPDIASSTEMVEAFQLCEYGRQLSIEELHGMFPGLPERVYFQM
jgi:hypothetical protein